MQLHLKKISLEVVQNFRAVTNLDFQCSDKFKFSLEVVNERFNDRNI